MTPEAVLHRYLQHIAEPVLDDNGLVALLCADADLLGRWLTMLSIPANFDLLSATIDGLEPLELRALAETQGAAELPVAPTARLSITQWQAVLKSALLAEALAEHLAEAEPSNLRDVRMRALLAVSGIHLAQDPLLAQIIEFRGTNPALLEDAGLEMRIFAVIDALEVGRELELAQMLLGLESHQFESLIDGADREAERVLDELEIERASDIDWGHRIWLRQQMQTAATAFAKCTDWSTTMAVHEKVGRTVFGTVPLVLQQREAAGSLRLVDGGDISIASTSRTSSVALALRAGSPSPIQERSDTAVVDRQLLRRLDTHEGLAVPILELVSGLEEPLRTVLVVATEEERDMATTALAYAQVFGRHMATQYANQNNIGERDLLVNEPDSELETFKANEVQRLREIVHEANNPLSIVHNYLHILELRLQHEPEALEQLELIGNELRRAGDIFTRARDVPEDDTTPAALPDEIRDIDLSRWLRDVGQLHLGLADEKGVEISVDAPEQAITFNTQPDVLAQIIGNLLKNAIEACERGDRVTLGMHGGAYRNGRFGVELFVSDDGPGLPKEVFAQLEAPKESQKGGDHQGIGLQLVFRLASEVEGTIDVHSTPAQGTTFSIFLPNTPAD